MFTIANRNSPGQVVVSGERVAVEAAAGAAKSLGAKRAIVLPVSVAAHSPLMENAAAGMRTALAGVTFHDPGAPLLANADARPLTTGEACRGELIEHLTRGVDWVRAVRFMGDAGVGTFVEVGPGKVLTGLIKRIAPDVEALAIDDPSASGGLRLPSLEMHPDRPSTQSIGAHRSTMRRPDFNRRVAVTGLGVISPIGLDVDTVWKNLVDGVTGLRRITRWDPTPYEAQVAGEIDDFNPAD